MDVSLRLKVGKGAKKVSIGAFEGAALNRTASPLFRAHPHYVLHRVDEDLAVPGFARLGKLADEVNDRLCILVIDHHLQLDLLQKKELSA